MRRSYSVLTAAAILLAPCPARAERLPLAHYTTAHGLPSNDLSVVVEDARGFLWIGSYRGLSRFDGRGFRNFGRDHGLDKSTNVTSLAAAPDDSIWVGVWGGLYRFDLVTGTFTEVMVEGRQKTWERVQVKVDRDGIVWCGAADGLYRTDTTARGRMIVRRVPLPPHVELPAVSALLIDRAGNLWVASTDLYRRGPDGRWTRVEAPPSARPDLETISLVEDHNGRILLTTVRGVWRIDPTPGDACHESCTIRAATAFDLQPGKAVANESGGLWVASTTGLVELDSSGRMVRRLTRDDGLAASTISPALLDRGGNLWLVADGNGLQRLASEGFTSYGASEGLIASNVASIMKTRAGELVVAGSQHVLQRFQNGRFIAARPKLPPGVRRPGWGWYQFDMQDRRGQWWIPTDDGLVHFSRPDRVEDLPRGSATVLRGGCFSGTNVFRVYEDSSENMWIGTTERSGSTLYRWDRSSGRFDCYSSEEIVGSHVAPTAFLDVGHGTMWIGFGDGQIARYRESRFECVFNCGDAHEGVVNALVLDSRGRLWIPTHRSGLMRVDNPAARRPEAVRLTMTDGLSSEQTYAVVEDRFGRLFVGTERGVDVLDGGGRVMLHFGTEDGLPSPVVSVAYADSNGDLWFGTTNGVARFKPHDLVAAESGRVLVDAIRVSGVTAPVSAVGEERRSGLVLQPDQRNIEIEFIGLPRRAAASLRFQYRLSQLEPWSPPSPTRSLVLAGLSSGLHRLEIRAVDVSGRASPHTAIVDIDVRPPFYWRPWFLLVAGLSVLLIAILAYQARVAHVTALERQRTEIAMDLHDQMGSQLASIGLLADLGTDDSIAPPKRRELFDQIAQTATQMGSALSDIVWSMRHRNMTIEDLGVHLREHVRRLFPSRPPQLDISYPPDWPRIVLTPAAGRGVLLIALEALHNVARHAAAEHVHLELQSRGRRWQLLVADDGRGLPPTHPGHHGFGLETMQHRALDLGATLDIVSTPDQGTTVTLTFDPRADSRRWRNRTSIRLPRSGSWG